MIESVIIQSVIVVELAVLLWWARPEPEPEAPARRERAVTLPAPAPEPEGDDLAALEHDLRIEALIQTVDPEWKLGDERDHIALIADPVGKIVEARLR